MTTREPPVERFYDPADLDPTAPRLYVWRNGGTWELLDETDTVLSAHATQRDAIDAALDRSQVRFSEILARGSTGRIEWRIDQNPALLELTEYWLAKRVGGQEAAD
jgi:hypothetical protein